MSFGWFRNLTVLVLALALGPAGCLACCLPAGRPAQSTDHSCCDPQEQPYPAQAGLPDTQGVCHLPPSGPVKQDASPAGSVPVVPAIAPAALPASLTGFVPGVLALSGSPPSARTPLVLRV